MGGQSSQQQNVNQNTTQNPYGPAMPLVSGIANTATGLLGNTGISPLQQQGLDQLTANAQQGNPYAPAIGGYAGNLLGGGGATAYSPLQQQALQYYTNQLLPFASGQNVGQVTPQLQNYLDLIKNDTTNSINSQFAAAGRDLSGANTQTLARGLSQGLAAPLLNQYNTDVQNQLGAIGNLYSGQMSGFGALQGNVAQGLANQGQGVGAATQALQAQNAPGEQLFNLGGMPFQTQASNLGLLAQLGVPIAGLGGTINRTGTVNQTNQMSPVQEAQGWSNVFGNLGRALFGGGG